MAVRPDIDLQEATIKSRNVNVAVIANRFVKLLATGTSDTDVVPAAAGDDMIADGVALESRAAGQRVDVVTYESGGKPPVLVGTGGATRGHRAKLVADGVADAGDTDPSVGHFAQTGVVGDLVGLVLGKS